LGDDTLDRVRVGVADARIAATSDDDRVGGSVSVRLTRLSAGAALAVVALLGTSCGSPTPPPPPPAAAPAPAAPPAGAPTSSTATAEPGTPSTGAPGIPAERVGQAHQAALGLIALGALGRQKGSAALHSLADQVTTDGRAADDKIRALASAQGLTLTDDLGSTIQGTLNDLQARSGQPFDQAWLRAVGDLVEQARNAANAVLSSSNAGDEAKGAARDALARLDALAAALRDASAKAGAGTPSAVNAGTGGQAADAPVLPAALVVLGALLVGSAVVLRRRRV
jgi:predicted outer membrane protein